jgi:hypothetical protein
VIESDSTICEVDGKAKHGAGFGYTHHLRLLPDPLDQGDTGDVLHVRMSKGQANTQRGIRRFCDELVPRVRRAGAMGDLSCGAGGVKLSVASRRPRL